MSDVRAVTERWRSDTNRTCEDKLRAIWLKWILTTTVRHLRDHATLALYWYGRGNPSALFQITLSSLQTNDPYVPERLLAASFGVIMAAPGEGRTYGDELTGFLNGLRTAFCGDDANSPTEHWLIRQYVDGIVELTGRYYPAALSEWTEERHFAVPNRPAPMPFDEERDMGDDPVHGLDFKNYTVGSLIPDRGNYQFDHPGYQEVLSWIRGRVRQLEWCPERFESVERSIAESEWRINNRPDRTEVYAKKYGWIGFFEAAGRLQDEGRLHPISEEGRLADINIDPSFPAVPTTPDLALPAWLSSEPTDLQTWVTEGRVEVADNLLRSECLGSVAGPWVALSGFLAQEDVKSRREVFGILRGILVRRGDEKQLRSTLLEREYPGNFWVPEPPEAHYVFSGEMPWSSRARQGRLAVDLRELYSGVLNVGDQQQISVEIPVHRYSWESYHSSVNEAGGYPVPATTLAEAFDLRAMPNSLDWCDPEGRRASLTLAAPSSFKSGHLLYIREDVIREYCDAHDYEFVWFVWGERGLYFADRPAQLPDWVYKAYADHSNIWRHVATLSDLAPPRTGS